MSKEHKATTPIIGISCGDVNGIGPEVIMKVLSDDRMNKQCTTVIYGSGKVFSYYRKLIKASRFNYTQIDSLQNIRHKKVNLLNVAKDEIEVKAGQITPEAGQLAFESLKQAATDLKEKKIDALVTAPINKDNIQNDTFKFPGHTEFFTALSEKKESLMLMTSEDLKIGMITGHVPVSHIKDRITKELIILKSEILNHSLKKDFGIQKPKIAILGLNPHAGENGLLGSEEKEIIEPAIEELKNKNILAFGPLSADGFFGSLQFKNYDGVIAMYHDQGLIPFKTLAFEKGVNYTAGLPFVRTSPDHGTAYDIAGRGIADETSFREAIFTAIDIVKNREQASDHSVR